MMVSFFQPIFCIAEIEILYLTPTKKWYIIMCGTTYMIKVSEAAAVQCGASICMHWFQRHFSTSNLDVNLLNIQRYLDYYFYLILLDRLFSIYTIVQNFSNNLSVCNLFPISLSCETAFFRFNLNIIIYRGNKICNRRFRSDLTDTFIHVD